MKTLKVKFLVEKVVCLLQNSYNTMEGKVPQSSVISNTLALITIFIK